MWQRDDEFISAVNGLLERELSGYRFVGTSYRLNQQRVPEIARRDDAVRPHQLSLLNDRKPEPACRILSPSTADPHETPH